MDTDWFAGRVFVVTGGTQGLGAAIAGALAAQPFGRLIKPDDVALASLFLHGPDSGRMTGSVIDYDQMVMGAY